MLAYQHVFHAGNLADVHKHAALAWLMDYMAAKPKPMTYIETHAGRGLYDLSGPEAQKTGEAQAGIAAVNDWFDAADPYARALLQTRAQYGDAFYPGSPLIAQAFLRRGDVQDSYHLAELHPAEADHLERALPHARIRREDGPQMALSIAPPTPRRGVAVIDPSFEGKADYDAMPKFLRALHKKWNVGVLFLWYPILTTGVQGAMQRQLRGDWPDAVHSTVRFAPARPGHGMMGSGLCIINPPWGMADRMAWIEARFAALPGGQG